MTVLTTQVSGLLELEYQIEESKLTGKRNHTHSTVNNSKDLHGSRVFRGSRQTRRGPDLQNTAQKDTLIAKSAQNHIVNHKSSIQFLNVGKK